MSETKATKRTRNIAFRLTAEEYAQAERAALAAGDNPNNWCRRLALAQSRKGYELTKNQRLIYEEIARVRYLAGHGFRLLLGAERVTAETWKELMGHASIVATMRYIHATDQGKRGAIIVLSEYRKQRRHKFVTKEKRQAQRMIGNCRQTSEIMVSRAGLEPATR